MFQLIDIFHNICQAFDNDMFSCIVFCDVSKAFSVGAKLIYIWAILRVCCTPQEENIGYYFQSETCLGASETHVLLSFLWSGFCKRPVITVTPQTLKIAGY